MLLKFIFFTGIVTGIFGASVVKSKGESKDLIVTEENQEEFGVPVGTELKYDSKTRRYIPPDLSEQFTKRERLDLIYYNAKTHDKFCKVGPESKSVFRIRKDIWWHTWCRGSFDQDLCCGAEKCSCNTLNLNCACLLPEDYDYFEEKKDEDLGRGKKLLEKIPVDKFI